MEFRNLSPFPAMNYTMVGLDDQEQDVFIIKVSYRMVLSQDNSCQLVLMDDNPIPLCFADEYWGEMNQSSVKQESDLSPFKPLCDVIINGTAYAPEGRACRQFETTLLLADKDNHILLSKKLSVHGPRSVSQISFSLTDMTSAEKIASLPMLYEYAFGGECRLNSGMDGASKVASKYQLTEQQLKEHPQWPDAPVAHTAHMQNTIGMGFIDKWFWKATSIRSIPVPQITSPQYPVKAVHLLAQIRSKRDENAEALKPCGFGIINRAWQPRLKKAGTYDEEWLEKRHPRLPHDFDFHYWNCAPEDQQIPYPANDIKLRIENMTPNGVLQCQLPGHRPFLLYRMFDGTFETALLNIDTLMIDTNELTVSITYRLVAPENKKQRIVEARFETDSKAPLFKIDPIVTEYRT